MEEQLEIGRPKQRLEWIDAMRGFTMILVVTNHVQGMAFEEIIKMASSMQFFLLFRMPLFFFISGFLAYRTNFIWSFNNFASMVGKKIRIQIIPTLIFFLVAVVLLHPGKFNDTVIHWIQSPMKGGYWFTLVLLYMFIIYYVFEYLENRLKQPGLIPVLVLWIISFCLSLTCYLPKHFVWAEGCRHPYSGWLNDTSFIEFIRYFHFFVFGSIIHRYWHKVERIFDLKGFYLLILTIAFCATTEYLKLHLLRMEWANITHSLSQYALLTLVFLFFKYYQNSFSQNIFLGKSLQYIGTRTLDIYLIHYLFIPYLPEIGKYFNSHHNNFAIDFTIALIVAIIVIGFCILTSNILRISPFLKKYLFGKK